MACPHEYAKSSEWWEATCSSGQRHADMAPRDLHEIHGGVAPGTWAKRRMDARAHYGKQVRFGAVAKGGAAAASFVPSEAPDPHQVVVSEPLTTEEKVERDKTVQKLRKEHHEIKAKYDAAIKHDNVYEELARLGREMLETVAPACPPPKLSRAKSKIQQSMVLNFADWHIDETVDYEIMEGLNWYDPPTALRRVECTVDKTLLIASLSERITYGTLYIHDFGDNCTNFLHEDAKPTNSMTPLKGARFAAEVKAAAIRDLAAAFPHVVFRGVPGNHGRMSAKMGWKVPTENLDWLVYQWTRDKCRDLTNVTFEIVDAWSMTADVEGWGFFLNHGTSDAKGGFGGISWYSLVKSDTKRTALDVKLNRKVLVRQYGHMHQSADVERAGGNGRIRIEPSLKGGDEFPKEGMSGTYSEAAQSLLEVHATEGLVAERILNIRQYDLASECRYDALLELV